MKLQHDQLDAVLSSLTGMAVVSMFFVLGLLASLWLFNFGSSALFGQAAIQSVLILVGVGHPAHKKLSANL